MTSQGSGPEISSAEDGEDVNPSSEVVVTEDNDVDAELSAESSNLTRRKLRVSKKRAQRHNRSNHVSDYDSDNFSTCSEAWDDTWSAINDRKVSEISIQFFYQPRTLTLLGVVLVILLYSAFFRNDDTSTASNVTTGLVSISFLFLAIGLLVFPNGPFTRPHPVVWRLVFGLSLLYFLLISFLLFQRHRDVMDMLHFIDPGLKLSEADSHTLIYTRNCDWSPGNIRKHLDIFVPAHILGWLGKALVVRHYILLWTVSTMWEVTEIFFSHILPNFQECWWDMLILDLLVCNGIGIYLGMKLIQWMEVRTFHWESIKDIRGTRGKIKRAVLQFTPQEVTHIRWLDPSSTYQRALGVFFLILIMLTAELSGFLIKHVLYIPSSHYLVTLRLLLIGLIGLPSIRQYYSFITDKYCDRMGTQAWVGFAILIAELLFSIKFGMAILPRPAMLYLGGWLLLIACVSVLLTMLFTMYSPTWGWSLLKNRKGRKKRRVLGIYNRNN